MKRVFCRGLNLHGQCGLGKDIKYITEKFPYEGIIMMILAAITETIIYFLVRDIKTLNNWNHLFISYGLGAIILSIYFSKDLLNIKYTDCYYLLFIYL